MCKAQIQYDRKTDRFYLIHDHSDECMDKCRIMPSNIKVLKIELYKFSDLKNQLQIIWIWILLLTIITLKKNQ